MIEQSAKKKHVFVGNATQVICRTGGQGAAVMYYSCKSIQYYCNPKLVVSKPWVQF